MKSIIFTAILLFLGFYFYSINFIATLLSISFLIFFHEFGHFIVARMLGVKVNAFSVGFGESVTSKVIKGTEYRLSAIPLGGYVSLKGQEDLKPELKNYDPDSYNSKTPFQRILILLAGPMFNIILAFFIYIALGFIGVERLAPKIGYVAQNSAASEAGLMINDEILSINGIKIDEWDDISKNITASKLDIKVKRENEILNFALTPKIGEKINIWREKIQTPLIGISQRAPTILTYDDTSELDSNSYKASLDPTNQKLLIEGTIAPNTRVNVLFFDMSKKSIMSDENGKFSITSDNTYPEPNFVMVYHRGFDSITYALNETYNASKLIIVGLEKLITGVVPVKEMGGIIAMSDLTSKAAGVSLSVLLILVALISVNLGILNLLPIPALDGGHIVFNLYEMIFKKPVSEGVFVKMSYGGMAILFALMAFTIINDILRMIGYYE